ncbi:hypothetical protein GWK47_018251 [Chionoecetes opilio]|uniref:Uncharacterized protein n=1 Tax=Chionoecetes opilio TaxID=41210 RepID=A0A8J4XR94_CHIOP|nr:hypothetical protein GWK47_018251 [Chionoecetes opilio]
MCPHPFPPPASAEPEQSPPPVMFSQQKGMSCSPGALVVHLIRVLGGVVQLKSDIINLLLVSGVFLGTGTDFFRCGPFFFPNVFFSAAAFFCLPASASSLPSTSGQILPPHSRLKCRPAPSSVPFHKDED